MRTTVKALHRGKPMVWQVSDITHFISGDKYTVAHHVDGRELLLNDTIRQLTDEFFDDFLLTSRGVLVSRSRLLASHRKQPERIEGVVYLAGVDVPLPCSRSRMPVIEHFLRSAA